MLSVHALNVPHAPKPCSPCERFTLCRARIETGLSACIVVIQSLSQAATSRLPDFQASWKDSIQLQTHRHTDTGHGQTKIQTRTDTDRHPHTHTGTEQGSRVPCPLPHRLPVPGATTVAARARDRLERATAERVEKSERNWSENSREDRREKGMGAGENVRI